jgi:hypothetical protein
LASQENTPNEFKWRFDKLLVLSGIHSYRFEPSKTMPGQTRFINAEEFIRLNKILIRMIPIEKMFHEFCKQFKARVELLIQESTI